MLINFKDTENNIICVLKDNELWQIKQPRVYFSLFIFCPVSRQDYFVEHMLQIKLKFLEYSLRYTVGWH